MVSGIRMEQPEGSRNLVHIFNKECKIRYNKKLSGKVRLYVSEKNGLKFINGILSLYKHNLH